MRPISIGHKNLLGALKTFASHCWADGSPIVDWTLITKEDFDNFRCSRADMHSTEMDDIIVPATMPVTISKSSSTAGEMQGNLRLTNGKDALHHVLSEVLCQPWWLLTEALERSGFNEIQDVLLMNQAERDMLTFLDANDVVTPLPQAQKNMLLDVKLFSSYCEDNGRPIMDWMKPRLISIVLHSTWKRRR